MTARGSTLVRRWVALYTRGLPPSIRDRRRAEIESDLWAHADEAAALGRAPAALDIEMLLRLVMGVPADLAWRRSHRAAPQPPTGRRPRCRRPTTPQLSRLGDRDRRCLGGIPGVHDHHCAHRHGHERGRVLAAVGRHRNGGRRSGAVGRADWWTASRSSAWPRPSPVPSSSQAAGRGRPRTSALYGLVRTLLVVVGAFMRAAAVLGARQGAPT